jgi:polyhydroxyalkanoate synthesis regulator phasin
MDTLRKGTLVMLGLLSLTREKVKESIDELIERGEMAMEEKFKFMGRLMEEAQRQEEELNKRIRETVHRIVSQMGFATREELLELKKRIEELEARISGQ